MVRASSQWVPAFRRDSKGWHVGTIPSHARRDGRGARDRATSAASITAAFAGMTTQAGREPPQTPRGGAADPRRARWQLACRRLVGILSAAPAAGVSGAVAAARQYRHLAPQYRPRRFHLRAAGQL